MLVGLNIRFRLDELLGRSFCLNSEGSEVTVENGAVRTRHRGSLVKVF